MHFERNYEPNHFMRNHCFNNNTFGFVNEMNFIKFFSGFLLFVPFVLSVRLFTNVDGPFVKVVFSNVAHFRKEQKQKVFIAIR